MTEITKLLIAPKNTWQKVDEENPLQCKIAVKSKNTIVETMLNAQDTKKILGMITGIIAHAAVRNVESFHEEVLGREGVVEGKTVLEALAEEYKP